MMGPVRQNSLRRTDVREQMLKAAFLLKELAIYGSLQVLEVSHKNFISILYRCLRHQSAAKAWKVAFGDLCSFTESLEKKIIDAKLDVRDWRIRMGTEDEAEPIDI